MAEIAISIAETLWSITNLVRRKTSAHKWNARTLEKVKGHLAALEQHAGWLEYHLPEELEGMGTAPAGEGLAAEGEEALHMRLRVTNDALAQEPRVAVQLA